MKHRDHVHGEGEIQYNRGTTKFPQPITSRLPVHSPVSVNSHQLCSVLVSDEPSEYVIKQVSQVPEATHL